MFDDNSYIVTGIGKEMAYMELVWRGRISIINITYESVTEIL